MRCFLRSSPFVARIACPTFAVCLKLVFVDAALRCPSQSSPIITYQRPTTGRQARPRASAQLFIYTFPTSDGSGDGFDGRLDRTRRVSNDGRHADSRRSGSPLPVGRSRLTARLRLAIDGLRTLLRRRRRRNYLSDGGKADRTKWTWRLSRSTADRYRGLGADARALTNLYVKSSFLLRKLADGRWGRKMG